MSVGGPGQTRAGVRWWGCIVNPGSSAFNSHPPLLQLLAFLPKASCGALPGPARGSRPSIRTRLLAPAWSNHQLRRQGCCTSLDVNMQHGQPGRTNSCFLRLGAGTFDFRARYPGLPWVAFPPLNSSTHVSSRVYVVDFLLPFVNLSRLSRGSVPFGTASLHLLQPGGVLLLSRCTHLLHPRTTRRSPDLTSRARPCRSLVA